jgi:hypothetical protein
LPLLCHVNTDVRVAAALAFGYIYRAHKGALVLEADWPSALWDIDVDALLVDPSNLLASGRVDEQQPVQKKAKKLEPAEEVCCSLCLLPWLREPSCSECLLTQDRSQLNVSARLRNQNKRRLAASSSSNAIGPLHAVAESVAHATEWTLPSFLAMLVQESLSPRWEVRHGVFLALQSCTMPKLQAVLADRAIRVLALERFNDFSGDRVVSPVRESAAALLGATLGHLSEAEFAQAARLLLQLLKRGEWEVRHAGLLGLRCATTSRAELMKPFIADMVSPLLASLQDDDDDVIAVAAETLLPIASELASQVLSCVGFF